MPTESIWTALPTGIGRGTLSLSVHVRPRLTVAGGGDDVLANFPAFAVWPPPDLAIDVVVGATTYPWTAVTVVSAPDPALWAALFPGSSRIRSFAPADRSQTPIHTYPLTKIVDFLRARYTAVALNSPDEFPSIVDLLADGFEDIRFSGRDGMEKWDLNRAALNGVLADNKVIDTRVSSTATFDFVQLEDFFASLDASDPAVDAAYAVPVESPRLDFHDAVQFVSQHPTLMRLLGLVLDLRVDTTAAPPALGPTTVAVIPGAAQLARVTTVSTPVTNSAISQASFTAVPNPSSTHLAPGWLRFDDVSQYEVVQVEADGGGLKAVDFAGNLKRKQLHPTEDTPTDAGLPTLRADGFAVARLGAAQSLHDTLVDGVGKETALADGSLSLYLDDITRGTRVDVWDSVSDSWHSVMARRGRYELLGGTIVVPVVDEGFLGSTATKKLLSDDLYQSEEVFWWDGWSLVVPRPGRTLSIDPQAADPLIDRPPNDPGPDFDARLHFDVLPGTLPRLRYGVDYRFRARLVDLAGNSLPADTDDDSHATEARRFGRFEPPQTPPVLLRTPNGPGESVETVVLRSNYDVVPAPPTAERHVVPAKIGQLMAEVHGLVDAPDPDPGAYSLLADLDAATLLNHPAIDGGTGDRNRFYDVDDVAPTWAPDPAAQQFALRLLDGPNAGDLSVHPLGRVTDWPNYRGVRLVLVEASGPPSFDPTTRVLQVPMEKADVVRARLSAVVDTDDLDQFALWQWIVDGVPPGPSGEQLLLQQQRLVRAGQHWMLEPYRVLTFVHAVRQPLARPEFPIGLQSPRQPATTWTQVTGPLVFNRKSTSRVDMLASWQEPVDDGPETAEPADVGTPFATTVDRQTAFTLEIDHDGLLDPTRIDLRERHELGDTKHRNITYRAVATTRFSEYFTSTDEFAFGGPESIVVLDTGAPAEGLVAGSVKLSYVDSTGAVVPLVEGSNFSVDLATGTLVFGDDPGLPPAGTSIRAVYLVPPITRETSDPPVLPDEFGPQLVSVPSSARPQAPKVRYVIPTFGWEEGEVVAGGEVVGVTSTRRGNGVRVYLERPWWTSGEGELLGIVLWPLAELADPPELDTGGNAEVDRRRPFVTQWGQDPIFGSRLLPARYPRLNSFPDAVGTDTGLTLAELGNSTARPVNVVGHTVGFDIDRDLWYCDIAVDPGPAYSPFIRLALARWQPASIVHAELSRVVLADFVQLAPDRFASVAFDDDTTLTVSLSGPTHTRTEASDGASPGSAQVIIESQRPNVTGDAAWRAIGSPIPMTASLTGSGIGQWIADVERPPSAPPGTYRLVIEQFELLGSEPKTKPPLANPFLPTRPLDTPRLVHTDIIPL